MSRINLINLLLHQRNGERYLEVTADNARSDFANISCACKATNFPNSSDSFFTHNKDKFDLIFIDGIHTEEQTLRDISNAFEALTSHGVIVLHDCMPPDAWHQREQEAYRIGENWNGAVWKAALRVFNETIFKCTLLDTDWGCGVIDVAKRQVAKCKQLPEKLNYELHYAWLLEYKNSVAAYLRDEITVFYHLACMGNWRDVFKEQMLQLKQNGFRQIKLVILGTKEDVEVVNNTFAELELEVKIIFQDPELRLFERPALLAIEDYARHNEGYILYLHSKGVSNTADETKVKWRRLMMRELVQNWESCMAQLPYYDIIGVNWRDMPPTSHFCGNFWYASTRYLRRLANFKEYYDKPRYQIWDRIENKRLGCEFWIGSGKEAPRILSLFCKNVDFCNHAFWR